MSAFDDILDELNDSVRAEFGETADYTSESGVLTASISDLVIERLGEDGRAACDIDANDVLAPGIGDLIEVGAESWRIYNRDALGSGYWPCRLRQLSEWAQLTIHTYNTTTDDWNETPAETLWAHIETIDSTEAHDEEMGSIKVQVFNLMMPYDTDITFRTQLRWGSRRLYVSSVVPDDSLSLSMMITASENLG
jgi:head-tail adaptor